MEKKDIELITKKYPNIWSISFYCRKFPKWLNVSSRDASTCQLTYIDNISVFFHLEEKKNDKKSV